MPEVDICVGDPVQIELAVYELWLKGLSVNEAARHRETHAEKLVNRLESSQQLTQSGSPDGFLSSVMQGETSDQYFAYNMLETWMVSVPPTLGAQAIMPMSPSQQQKLIELYFSFDKHTFVPRELIGKKLTGRLRSNLDDVAEKTGVPLKSCRRQFDNMRRVFRQVEDLPGCLVANIQRTFLLPRDLASKYASIVFMANSKFETSKKRLNYLSFNDFHVCVEQMIDHWTVGAEAVSGEQDVTAANVDTDVDRLFLQELKEVRGIVEAESDSHRSLAVAHLHGKLPDQQLSTLDAQFKQLSKCILKIAEGLVHKTEFKDFFSDLEEKFMEPCRQWEYTAEEIGQFVTAMSESSRQLEQLTRRKRTHAAYQKYLKAVLVCVQQFAVAKKRY